MCSNRRLQLTLAIFKPDLVLRPYCIEHVRALLLKNNFIAIKSKKEHLSRSKVEDFYREHESKFFYNRLVTYMSSGPSHVHILGHQNEAIKTWRQLMGPTKVCKTRYENPETIRGLIGLTDTRNSTHGSDSDETAEAEIKFFFPEFKYDQFFSCGQDEQFLKSQNNQSLRLDRTLFQHFI